MADETSSPFWARHEFLIRRLHSLAGLIPVGAYMVVHLTVNASMLQSAATYQQAVYQIHSLGFLLPVVEWTFIFIPLLFHAILGVVIIRGGLPNNSTYRYANNYRYTLQRATGMIAFVFIFWHVFHMHGWFHTEWWLENVAKPFGGAQFAPYNATSTVGEAMRNWFYPPFYAVGILASVFHLANGIWTMGITWGLWVTPVAQRRADWVCLILGLGVGVVGMSALVGAVGAGTPAAIEEAEQAERKMFEAKVESGELDPESELVKHKLKGGHGASEPVSPKDAVEGEGDLSGAENEVVPPEKSADRTAVPATLTGSRKGNGRVVPEPKDAASARSGQ